MSSPFAARTAPAAAPGIRGYRHPAGGHASYVEAPVEYYGPSNQICGLWPHVAGVGHPTVGVPMGRHLHTGAAVCCDPINWFKAGLIPNPGMSLLGLTGRGKSSYAASMLLGLMASGVKGLILGDLKPDYAGFVQALGGDVVKIGRGHGSLNMLDPGTLLTAARRPPAARGRGAADPRRGHRTRPGPHRGTARGVPAQPTGFGRRDCVARSGQGAAAPGQ